MPPGHKDVADMAVDVATLPSDYNLSGGGFSKRNAWGHLRQSHFSLAQDESTVDHGMLSVFKKDYPPWLNPGKARAAEPPLPAHLFHTDDRVPNQRWTETQRSYVPHSVTRRQQQGKNLGVKTFVSESDPSRFVTFQTSHNEDYIPHALYGGSQKVRSVGKLQESHIPEGDVDGKMTYLSDYKHCYVPHQEYKREPGIDKSSRFPTVRGDSRQGEYLTTHNMTYHGISGERVKPFYPARTDNIPDGDREKIKTTESEHRSSYKPYQANQNFASEVELLKTKLQQSHFTVTDDKTDYNSVTKQSYLPSQVQARQKILRTDKESHIPEGDIDPDRNRARFLTTNQFHDLKVTERPKPVRIVKVHGQSEVLMGNPDEYRDYFSTTNNDVYLPHRLAARAGSGQSKSADFKYKSSVPMAVFEDGPFNSTYKLDFQDKNLKRRNLSREEIAELRRSNVNLGLESSQRYSTEHQDRYIPTNNSVSRTKETGKLQRSSVPLGTLDQYY